MSWLSTRNWRANTLDRVDLIQNPMSLVRSIAASTGLYLGTVLWTGVSILIAAPAYCYFRLKNQLGPQEATRKLIWIYGRAWVGLASLFMPVKRHLCPIPSPCVMVANHASIFDVYFMGAQPQWNVCMALKGWPFKIPCYSWFMKAAGYLNLDTMELGEMQEKTEAVLASGAALLFFPEGTRSQDGKLGRFRSGAFLVAARAGVKIIPLCFKGTDILLPPGKKLIQPSCIMIRALDAVETLSYQSTPSGHLHLRNIVKTMMQSELQSM